jgi:hypothetical protein
MENKIFLTIDVDWAPDFVIDSVADELMRRQIATTWLITHSSPAVDRLRQNPRLFELGIHPNFLSGSTHGNSIKDVFWSCLQTVPEAVTMRSHALVQSTPIYAHVLDSTPIEIDLSLFMPYVDNLAPFPYTWGKRTLWRVPYYWEDDYEACQTSPRWSLSSFPKTKGLQILNFHPIHIFLNSRTMHEYENLKRSVHRIHLATIDQITPFVGSGPGTKSLFFEVLDHLAADGGSMHIRDWFSRRVDLPKQSVVRQETR